MNGRIRMVVAVTALAAAIVPALGVPVGAHVADDVEHVWTAHIRPRLADPGTINTAANPVDWTRLKGVPAGLADGADSTGPLAGFGLTRVHDYITGNDFDRVDETVIQRRFIAGCSSNAGLRSLPESGRPFCDVDDSVKAFHARDTGDACTAECEQARLDLAAGSYAVIAKVGLSDQAKHQDLTCILRLNAGSTIVATDRAGLDADAPGSEFVEEGTVAGSLVMVAAAFLRQAGPARVHCYFQGGEVDGLTNLGRTQITAIPLSGITSSDG